MTSFTKNYGATKEARRYIARCVAELIDPANGHENAFLYDTEKGGIYPSKEMVRRCKKALSRLVARLRKEAKAP